MAVRAGRSIPPGIETGDAMVLAVIVGAVFLLGGIFLLVFGVRGRRVDDHPVCRKCGFDLYGRPEESTRCSECGTDLRKRRTVRVGNRKKRRRVAGMGAAGVSLGILWLGSMGWIVGRGID